MNEEKEVEEEAEEEKDEFYTNFYKIVFFLICISLLSREAYLTQKAACLTSAYICDRFTFSEQISSKVLFTHR